MRSRITQILLVFSCVALAALGGAENTQGQGRKVIYQINCGGPAVDSYAQDSYFDGGSKYDNNDGVDAADVPNAPPAKVYKYQRYGNFIYSFPNLTPNAPYVVRLHFAEIYFNKAQVGRRVFNVSINRQTALDHFDILVAAGEKDRAIVEEFNVNADDSGRIRIVFESVVTNATINAIEILQGSGSSVGPSSTAKAVASPSALPSKSAKHPTFRALGDGKLSMHIHDNAYRPGRGPPPLFWRFRSHLISTTCSDASGRPRASRR